MAIIHDLLKALDERTIAQKIAIPHDEARMRYSLERTTCDSFEDFENEIGNYYNYHYNRCNTQGGHFSPEQARSRAKGMLEQIFRRQGLDLSQIYHNAKTGAEGGLRTILDAIADSLKREAIENYLRDTMDQFVTPISWQAKVDIMAQLLEAYGELLPQEYRNDPPERFAQGYDGIIHAVMGALQQTSAVFRRM